jgi:hypothetical protein
MAALFEQRSSEVSESAFEPRCQAASECTEKSHRLQRLRAHTDSVNCNFCGLSVHAAEAVHEKGSHYHKECFQCAACHRSLCGVPYNAVDDLFYCSESGHGRNCFQKLRQASCATSAARASTEHGMTLGSKKMVAKAYQDAVEVIGSDLEDIISNMVPKCTVCNGSFKSTDQIIMQGMMKMHKDCLRLKQSGKISEVDAQTTPARACASTPRLLLVKLQLQGGKVMTFFLAKVPDDNKKATSATWLPDTKARTSNKRGCQREELSVRDGVLLRAVGELGADLATPVRPTLAGQTDDETRRLFAVFSWTSHSVHWELKCELEYDNVNECVSASSAELVVTPAV